jgi:hypothetical protein
MGAAMGPAAAVFGLAVMTATAGGLTGCANNPATTDYNLLFTSVKPIEYARILCANTPMEDRHTCMTSVIAHNRATRALDLPPENIIRAPFIMFLDRDLYQGRYVSQPFAAAFTVAYEGNVCRGRYNAFAGDTKAVFRVRCDDGTRGSANIILDAGGRNGIGEVETDDGRTGRIVFGLAAVGGDFQ